MSKILYEGASVCPGCGGLNLQRNNISFVTHFRQTYALLPIDKLQEIQNELQNTIVNADLKEKCKFARNLIIEISKK